MNVKLTKRKAWELISRIQPRLNIKQEATPSDVAIFKASTGPEGLEIRCENDWFYSKSGEAGVFTNHQEIQLEPWKGYA